MIFPVLKGLSSPDLNEPSLPEDPSDCAVLIEAEIGSNGQGADIFSFTVITPTHLMRERDAHWGRGQLIVSEFTWEGVRSAVTKLLSHASRETWEMVAAELSKELRWEYENYRDV